MRRDLVPYLAPSIIYTFIFFLFPLVETVYLSFYNIPFTGRIGAFVGLKNYYDVITQNEFQYSIWFTTVWTTSSVLLCILLGLGLAFVLNENFPGRGVIRSLILVPWLLPATVTSIMWRWTLHPEFGIINYTLTCLGITKKAIPFLSDPTLALLSLILVRVWRGAPYAAFSFLAGLQSIPKEIYEAAEVDGASTLHKFLHISLPLLKPIFAMVTTLLLIWTFQLFEIIYVLTGGGPYGSTITFSIYIYQAIFSRGQINLANSGSVIVAALMTIASYIYFRRFGRK